MRQSRWVFVGLATCLVLSLGLGAQAAPKPSNNTVLVLYDSTGEYGWTGVVHARMLANLIGHFSLTPRLLPVESYAAGDIEKSRAAFYVGITYDNALPNTFLTDVMTTTKPVCWFKYNLWKLAWYQPTFQTKFGFMFDTLDWTGYHEVRYRGQSFSKYQADPEVGLVHVTNPSLATSVATAYTPPDALGRQLSTPYILRGGNLWYVADAPFAYISEEDRYVVFSDVLHDILGINHATSRRAIMRIEDVDPTADPDSLRAIADYLRAQHVPFAVSVIPVYQDPLGYYSGGVPETVRLSQSPEVVAALKYMVSQGGSIVLHGYTHQYGAVPNPYNGVTGDDFEFYRIALDELGNTIYSGPVPEDSRKWAQDRVTLARNELKLVGLTPVAWETPHYAASSLDYQVFATNFTATLQRALYFDYSVPLHGKPHGTVPPTLFGGQFFPYIVFKDIYGQKVLPENLGNVEPEAWQGYGQRLPADIIRAAEKNLAVRDAWASAYFHPFYDLAYLQELVQGVKALGYTYVPVRADLR